MTERIIDNPHDFWLETSGYDTYARSQQHARHDTPWNAFTRDQKTLVCALWRDQIAHVHDPVAGHDRKFVLLGGKLRSWKGPSVKHGAEARSRIDEALNDNLRLVGFEAEPHPEKLKKQVRQVKCFYLDRAHELKPIFHFSGDALRRRLALDKKFSEIRIDGDENVLDEGYLFELVPVKDALNFSGYATNYSNSESPAVDETSNREGDFVETTTYSEFAARALVELIAHVATQTDNVLRTLTYTELAIRIGKLTRAGRPWLPGIGEVLHRVTLQVQSATSSWHDPAPLLTAAVVTSGTGEGIAGDGLDVYWPGYSNLSRIEKERQLADEHQRILSYGARWLDVLDALGLDLPEGLTSTDIRENSQTPRWGTGESPEHKALRLHVMERPQIVRASLESRRDTESDLPSGDRLDVYFEHTNEWVGVEVKSRVSDRAPVDYERGIFQVVKYRAVLAAKALTDKLPVMPKTRAVLVLETSLPDRYRELAKQLDVEVIEGVVPHGDQSPQTVATFSPEHSSSDAAKDR